MAGFYIRTDEHKKMMSDKSKGRKSKLKGKKRPPFSEKWKKNISISKTGKCIGENNSFYGKKHTEESKKIMGEKISKDLIGNKRREGIKHTEESKLKISKSLKGKFAKEKNPQWKGGITDELKVIRYSDEYYNWRNEVFKRDNFQCKSCNDNTGNNLNAHHIFSFSTYPEIRFDINNGLTVCEKCHKLLHKIYGRECKKILKDEWIDKLNKSDIPVFMKNNLKPIMGNDLKQEFPK